MKANTNWDSSLTVGLDVVDNQHKILFDLIKDLKHTIGTNANIKILDALLSVLLNYAFNHFKSEEEYLINHSDFKEHCFEHYLLIKRLHAFINEIRNNRINKDKTPSAFLEEWLLDHIKRFDKPFFSDDSVIQFLIRESKTVDDYSLIFEERRQNKRIPFSEVVDGSIVTHYYNATQLFAGKAKIIDMSPGGLRLRSNNEFKIDDLMVVSCGIGRSFNMIEKVQVKSANAPFYGVEFISPAKETTTFFKEFDGAVHSNRAKMVQSIS